MRLPARSIAALAAGVIAVAAIEDPPLSKPAPVTGGGPVKLARAGESKCNECHASIVEEWAWTAHALAWQDEVYQEELKGRKKAEACHGCHIPAPLHGGDLGTKPEPRKDDLHFGISCESCHAAPDGALLGPTGAPTDKHATRKSDSMSGAGTTALCASCHRTTVGPVIGIAKDFEQSAAAKAGKTCVGCHMAALKSVPFEGGTREVRSHEIQTPRDPSFLARAFAFALAESGGKTVLRVENRAGHRVPGLIGREIAFEVRAFDASGKELAKERLIFDSSSYLAVDEPVALELGVRAAKVRITGEHTDTRSEKPIRFVEREIAP
jgi:hypothetical protein